MTYSKMLSMKKVVLTLSIFLRKVAKSKKSGARFSGQTKRGKKRKGKLSPDPRHDTKTEVAEAIPRRVPVAGGGAQEEGIVEPRPATHDPELIIPGVWVLAAQNVPRVWLA